MSIYDFSDYLKSLQPAMATLLLRGGVETLDSYARPRVITPGTAGIGLVLRKDGKGFYIGQERTNIAGGGYVSIADAGAAPELQMVSGTIFWASKYFQTLADDYAGGANSRIISKRAVGTMYEVVISAAGQMTISCGVNTCTLTSTSLTGAKTCAIRYVSGGVPSLFTDGNFRVVGVTALNPVVDTTSLYMMNRAAAERGSKNIDYALFVLFNDALRGSAITNEEIANLHSAWRGILSVHETNKKIFIPAPAIEVVGATPLVQLFGAKNASGLVLDATGNGRNGAVSGRVTQTRGPAGVRQQGHGAGNPLIAAAADTSLYPNSFSLKLKYNARSIGESSKGCFWSISDSGTTRTRLYLGAANTWYYEVAYASATARWTFTAGPYNVDHVLTLTHARSAGSVPVVKIDGVLVTVTQAVAPSGALTACAAPVVNRLNTAALDSDFDGALLEEIEYAAELIDAQTKALYVADAIRCNELATRTQWPISLAAVGAGGYCGPWRSLSGTQKWDDDGTRRRLLAVTTGYFTSREPSNQAYGAWYFRASKGTDAGLCLLPLMASNSVILTGNLNGYVLYLTSGEEVILRRYDAGVSTNVAATATGVFVVGTEYEFFITRQSVADAAGHAAGYWSVWIRGGAYTTWTSLLTGTDDTHTTSNCLVGYLDAGGTISDYRQYGDGAGLLPTDIAP